MRENAGRSVGTRMGGKGRESSRRQTSSPKHLGSRGPGPQLEPHFPSTWLIFSGLWGGGTGGGDSFKGTRGSWVVTPRGADPWAERAERGPAPPRRSSCNPGLLPSQDRESLPVRVSHGAGALAGPPLRPCQGGAGASPNDRDGRRRPCGQEGLLAGGLSKTGGLVPAARVCPKPGIPKAEAEVTHTPRPLTHLCSPPPPSPFTAALS